MTGSRPRTEEETAKAFVLKNSWKNLKSQLKSINEAAKKKPSDDKMSRFDSLLKEAEKYLNYKIKYKLHKNPKNAEEHRKELNKFQAEYSLCRFNAGTQASLLSETKTETKPNSHPLPQLKTLTPSALTLKRNLSGGGASNASNSPSLTHRSSPKERLSPLLISRGKKITSPVLPLRPSMHAPLDRITPSLTPRSDESHLSLSSTSSPSSSVDSPRIATRTLSKGAKHSTSTTLPPYSPRSDDTDSDIDESSHHSRVKSLNTSFLNNKEKPTNSCWSSFWSCVCCNPSKNTSDQEKSSLTPRKLKP